MNSSTGKVHGIGESLYTESELFVFKSIEVNSLGDDSPSQTCHCPIDVLLPNAGISFPEIYTASTIELTTPQYDRLTSCHGDGPLTSR